jgi:ribulose-phosphate 3-epimerase
MSKQPRIVPAIIASSPDELDTNLRKVIPFAPIIQLDVMDGLFVPNKSLDFEFKLPKGPHYQVHLMVTDVKKYVKRFNREMITLIIHVESLEDLTEVVNLKTHNVKLFLAINPETPVEKVFPVIDKLDGVMVMTVNPGKYGSKFLPECLDKVEELKALRRSLTVEVDGGMIPETVRLARRRGVDIFTSGSYILKSPDPLKAYRELEEAAEG